MTWLPMIFERRWRCKLGFHRWTPATSLYGARQEVCQHCRVVRPGTGEPRS